MEGAGVNLMNIVFIHGNFPGQFKNLVFNIENVENINTYFITEKDINIGQANTDIIQMKRHRDASKNTHHYLTSTEECILRGQAVVRSIEDLAGEGVSIDIVICHGGMGYGLFIKDICPNAIVISYNEWYFTAENSKHIFANYTFDEMLTTRTRNFTTLSEIESCDIAVCPTEWQKEQFPNELKGNIKVIYDGIDHRFFSEKNINGEDQTIKNRDTNEEFILRKTDKIISYATRGMEPLRSFNEFMRAIPYILDKDDNIKIVIAGADRVAYSYGAPSHGGSWKQHELAKLETKVKKRIIFTGLLDWDDYRKLLRRSNLHCYFSKPYVLSWSFIEAAACKVNMATNRMRGMQEVIDESSVHWMDIEDPKVLADGLYSALKKPMKAKLVKSFSLEEYLLKWQETINELIQRRK